MNSFVPANIDQLKICTQFALIELGTKINIRMNLTSPPHTKHTHTRTHNIGMFKSGGNKADTMQQIYHNIQKSLAQYCTKTPRRHTIIHTLTLLLVFSLLSLLSVLFLLFFGCNKITNLNIIQGT